MPKYGVHAALWANTTGEDVAMSAPIAVGDLCTVQRIGVSGLVHNEWQCSVTKVTPKRAYMGKRDWFALNDPRRIVLPKYCDYTTRVVAITKGDVGAAERKGGDEC